MRFINHVINRKHVVVYPVMNDHVTGPTSQLWLDSRKRITDTVNGFHGRNCVTFEEIKLGVQEWTGVSHPFYDVIVILFGKFRQQGEDAV